MRARFARLGVVGVRSYRSVKLKLRCRFLDALIRAAGGGGGGAAASAAAAVAHLPREFELHLSPAEEGQQQHTTQQQQQQQPGQADAFCCSSGMHARKPSERNHLLAPENNLVLLSLR